MKASPPRPAEASLTRRLEMLVDDGLQRLPVPGLNAALLVDDEVVWTYAVGTARFSPRTPLRPDHLHRIGSITKVFTAHAVLGLRDRGLLDIDAPVATYLPEFAPEGGERVTIRHILCHGSGIETNASLDVWRTGVFPDDEAFRQIIRGFRLVAPPMTHAKYSNASISMLGLIVASVTDTTFEEHMQTAVLDPLGMTDTYFYLPDGMEDRFAPGHTMPPDEERFLEAPHHDLKSWNACGMLLSTPADTLKLAAAQWAPDSPWSEATRREMHRLHNMDADEPGWTLGYGLGWRPQRHGDRIFPGHAGGYVGNRCHMSLSLADRVAVALYANGKMGFAVDQLTHELVVAAIEALPPAKPKATNAAPVPDHLRPFLGRYTVRHWGEIQIEYDADGLRIAGEAGNHIRLRDLGEGRLEIGSSRSVGEEVNILELDAQGRAKEIMVAGRRHQRV